MQTALIVVDVQNDFCEGGALAVSGGAAVARRIDAYLASQPEYTVRVATRDHHIDPGAHFADAPDFVDSWPPHCVAETSGAEQHPHLTYTRWDGIFLKGQFEAAYSGFEGRDDATGMSLLEFLTQRGVTQVDVCGIATDYCVAATVRDAMAAGFRTRVLSDLVAAVHPESVTGLEDTWRSQGIVVAPSRISD